jgi:type III secretion protein C
VLQPFYFIRRANLIRWGILQTVAYGLLIAVTALPSTAQSAEVAWKNANFIYLAQDKPIAELLREFCGSQELACVISDQIKEKMSGRVNSKVERVLPQLASMYGLMWYYDGVVIHINTSGESKSATVQLRYVTPAQLTAALARMKIFDSRYPLKFDESGAVVLVSGPKRYVELVEEVAISLDVKAATTDSRDRRANVTLKVFPLKYAWAQDLSISSGAKEIVIPGVASTLRRLTAGDSGIGASSSPQTTGVFTSTNLPKLKGKGLSEGSTRNESTNRNDAVAVDTPITNTHSQQSAAMMDHGTRIDIDLGTNSILVRDHPDQMAKFAELIAALDVAPRLIQIEASIVDISTDALEDLGIDWSQSQNDFIFGRGRQTTAPTESIARTLAEGAAGQVAGLRTVLGNAGSYFLARVNLLARNGKANITSRPSVLTMNNLEAVIENSRTFYVRVAGDREVDLFNITAGVVLRVTPLIVDEGDHKRIKLAVRIEDGSLLAEQVDRIPVVERHRLSTQAIIGEGESLLIGGHTRESVVQGDSRVPGLADIPIAGVLFRGKKVTTVKTERLFMITPRLVSM